MSRAYPDFFHESPHNIVLDSAASQGEPLNLVAFSMGGYLALEFALDRPRDVRSLVVIGTSAFGLSEEEKAELEAELLAEDAAAGRAWGDEIDRRAQHVLRGEASGLSREEVRSLFAMSPADARARLTALLDSKNDRG